jgi:hypothetical protein
VIPFFFLVYGLSPSNFSLISTAARLIAPAPPCSSPAPSRCSPRRYQSLSHPYNKQERWTEYRRPPTQCIRVGGGGTGARDKRGIAELRGKSGLRRTGGGGATRRAGRRWQVVRPTVDAGAEMIWCAAAPLPLASVAHLLLFSSLSPVGCSF